LAGGAAALFATRRNTVLGALPVSVLQARPEDAQFRRVSEGVARGVLWGDPARGAYGAFTAFEPGLRHPLHSHPHDILIVVLSGAYLYRLYGAEHRAEAGTCVLLPANAIHASGGDEQEGALFFETSNGAFELVPVE
jgi:quercetin dioxygenase-like cupin family protein